MKKRLIIILLIILIVFCSSCSKEKSNKVIIAEQYGLAYAPVEIIRELDLLKNYEDIEIEWIQLSNTAAIREAMLAGECDVGFMAIPPFLIGWDKGMEWKIMTGLSSCPVGLVSNDSKIKSISDFGTNDRIALPQLGSIQHILLSMECERIFGDATKLNNIIVSMKHPDGMNALLSDTDITAHFTSPPYIFEELKDENNSLILSGEEAMGSPFSFIVGTCTNSFHNNNEKAYNAVVNALKEAIEYIKNNPQEAADILAERYELDSNIVLEYINQINYDTNVKGINGFNDFMLENGYISNEMKNLNEIAWENVEFE